jgi:hypothetical protein
VLYLLPKKSFLKRLAQSSNPRYLFGKYILILLAYHLYDYAYELCEEADLEAAHELKKLLHTLSISKKQLMRLIVSLFIGAGKYALAFSKKTRQHRLDYLVRKTRQIGNACLYLGKNEYALYD